MRISEMEKFLYERRRVAGNIKLMTYDQRTNDFFEVTPVVGKIITRNGLKFFVDPSMLVSLTRTAEYVEADSELEREYGIMVEAGHTNGMTLEQFIADRRRHQDQAQQALIDYFAADFVIRV